MTRDTHVSPKGEAPAIYHIIFYDAVCGLCDRFVCFVISRDITRRFRFASLQGNFARVALRAHEGGPESLETMYVLTSDGQLIMKSRAVLFVTISLGGPWRFVRILTVVPSRLADRIYDVIASVRYRIFGRYAACTTPPIGSEELFLECPDPCMESSDFAVTKSN